MLSHPENNTKEVFTYIPPAKFHPGDVVIVANPVRWGLPIELDEPLNVVKEGFTTKVGWTATVEYQSENYEVWEEALVAISK